MKRRKSNQSMIQEKLVELINEKLIPFLYLKGFIRNGKIENNGKNRAETFRRDVSNRHDYLTIQIRKGIFNVYFTLNFSGFIGKEFVWPVSKEVIPLNLVRESMFRKRYRFYRFSFRNNHILLQPFGPCWLKASSWLDFFGWNQMERSINVVIKNFQDIENAFEEGKTSFYVVKNISKDQRLYEN